MSVKRKVTVPVGSGFITGRDHLTPFPPQTRSKKAETRADSPPPVHQVHPLHPLHPLLSTNPPPPSRPFPPLPKNPPPHSSPPSHPTPPWPLTFFSRKPRQLGAGSRVSPMFRTAFVVSLTRKSVPGDPWKSFRSLGSFKSFARKFSSRVEPRAHGASQTPSNLELPAPPEASRSH